MTRVIQKQSSPLLVSPGKHLSYNEIIEYLETHWSVNTHDTALKTIKTLDASLGNLAQKIPSIIVTGTNGKSLTSYFISQLLQEEKITVGILYAPHIMTYNERFVINNEPINNKQFTDIGNEVINTIEMIGTKANSADILTMMGILYFNSMTADVIILESDNPETVRPISICQPVIVAVSRITNNGLDAENATEEKIRAVLNPICKNTYTISADQSKLNLQSMETITESLGGIWAMPIRKLAPLPYPFEQLHGRCAALAERVAQIFVNDILNRYTTVMVQNSLLTKQKGQRGRPTIEAKKKLQTHPRRTIEQFWRVTLNTLSGRFQLLEKEKPIILLDTASNLDAFKNLFLGIRLLNYQNAFKGIAIILGCEEGLDADHNLLKLLRYFFKKTSGYLIVCPLEKSGSVAPYVSWDVDKITTAIKAMKIKVLPAHSFSEAFEMGQKLVDERDGLLVISGSPLMVSSYWRLKGIKKV